MKNDKQGVSEIVGAASRFAGALVGAVVVGGKEAARHLKNMIAAEQRPSSEGKKNPTRVPAKKQKKRGRVKKRCPEGGQAKTRKRAARMERKKSGTQPESPDSQDRNTARK